MRYSYEFKVECVEQYRQGRWMETQKTFFGRMKNEMFYGHEKDFNCFESFSLAVDEYIYYYSNERIQAKTKWMPPVKYREASLYS